MKILTVLITVICILLIYSRVFRRDINGFISSPEIRNLDKDIRSEINRAKEILDKIDFTLPIDGNREINESQTGKIKNESNCKSDSFKDSNSMNHLGKDINIKKYPISGNPDVKTTDSSLPVEKITPEPENLTPEKTFDEIAKELREISTEGLNLCSVNPYIKGDEDDCE